jgi:hypothetical protein
MDLSALHVAFDPRDLGLQSLDSLYKLFDRQRIQVLAGQRHQRIVGLARE